MGVLPASLKELPKEKSKALGKSKDVLYTVVKQQAENSSAPQ
jgi:hypothetical protein